MNKKKLENVIALPVQERYAYFVRKVTDFEEVWALSHEAGFATLSDDKGIVVPFWPEEEFALLCCSDQWEKYTPKLISLDDFMHKWLPGMEKDGRKVNVFYLPDTGPGNIIGPLDLLKDLKEELQNYL